MSDIKFDGMKEHVLAQRKVYKVYYTNTKHKERPDVWTYDIHGRLIAFDPSMAVCNYDHDKYKYTKNGFSLAFNDWEGFFLYNDWRNMVFYKGLFTRNKNNYGVVEYKRGRMSASIYNDSGKIIWGYMLDIDHETWTYAYDSSKVDDSGRLIQERQFRYQVSKYSKPWLAKRTDMSGYSITMYRYRLNGTLSAYSNVNDCGVCTQTKANYVCDSAGLVKTCIVKSEKERPADTFLVRYTFRK
ncbi:MAG: hypothetical protein EOP51_15705 [Sphingobacteriales bacterium]|nr:MAG: hypothetical protein EOP51_15705 [Sphingobacteriales bacterium]